jgi:hypothetical protein
MRKRRAFSIIIPDTNSLVIGEIVDRLKHQTVAMSQAEVLVVGVDEPELVNEDDLVRFIPTDEQTSHASGKRNLGMREAQGELFLFLDDDCLPALDWLDRHLRRHRAGEKVVGGAVTFGTDNYLQLADNVSAFHDLLPFTEEGPRLYLATANLSVRRDVVEVAGEMEKRFKRAEDLEWTVRFRTMGYRLYFDPSAVVFHDPDRRSLARVWRHWVDDAPDTLSVRWRYARWLKTPRLARCRAVFLWAAPLVAAWATARTFTPITTLRRYGHTLPLVYLTKLAWCWGAFRDFPPLPEEEGL